MAILGYMMAHCRKTTLLDVSFPQSPIFLCASRLQSVFGPRFAYVVRERCASTILSPHRRPDLNPSVLARTVSFVAEGLPLKHLKQHEFHPNEVLDNPNFALPNIGM
jgi:hypothetical protein